MTLGLSMIVKNESEVLDRVLSRARAFADEIVIVDTGSTDDTVEIAKKYTDKVYDFVWCDDFSAARNFAKEKVSSDFFMWLDADDVIPQKSAAGIARLARKLDASIDAVMLPYVLATDGFGKPTYTYYRERIMKNTPDFVWRGNVHEAVALHGNVVTAPHAVYHSKPTGRDVGTRNLDIYRKLLAEGKTLEPRERYYYARELYFNERLTDAVCEFEKFIECEGGFVVNKADASVLLGKCFLRLGEQAAALAALYGSFRFGLPSAEACCEIAGIHFSYADYPSAIYWYKRALASKPNLNSCAFVDADCHGFIPCVWLCVCYDKIGKYKTAYAYHCRARKLRPDHPSVIANEAYFETLGFGAVTI